MSKARVLCYSPYTYWRLHGVWEATILHSLKIRGAEVKTVFCGGVFDRCDLAWQGTPKGALTCNNCISRVSDLATGLQLPFEWLKDFLLEEEETRAREWVAGLKDADLFEASYGDWQVGEWVRSSVASFLRSDKLVLNSQAVAETYRPFVLSGLLACFGLERLIASYKPTVMLQFSGRFSSTRVALEMAKKYGIRIICHERGLRDETITLYENGDCHDLKGPKQIWERGWGDIPLRVNEIKDLQQLLNSRRYGKNLGWHPMTAPPQQVDHLSKSLGLHKEATKWVLFTSSSDETAASPDWWGVFASQEEWILQTIDFVSSQPEIELIIRVHPNTGGKYSQGRNDDLLGWFEELSKSLPENVRIVMPDDSISSYTVMDLATVGLIYSSTIGLEMACTGAKVVVASGTWCSNLPFVETVKSTESYFDLLAPLVKLPPVHRDLSIQRSAGRFAYRLFFQWCIDFPLVKMPGPHHPELNYTELSELEPGRDEGLDRICGVLLHRDPVVPYPGEEEASRCPEDELNWYKQNHSRPSETSLEEGFIGEALSYYKEGKLKETVKSFYQAIAINPLNADNYAKLSVVLWEQGRVTSALQHAKKALNLDPNNLAALLNTIRMLRSVDNHEAAQAIIDSIRDETTDSILSGPISSEQLLCGMGVA